MAIRYQRDDRRRVGPPFANLACNGHYLAPFGKSCRYQGVEREYLALISIGILHSRKAIDTLYT